MTTTRDIALLEITIVGNNTIATDQHHQLVTTTLPDGSQTTATPNHDPDSLARARSLGYTGTDAEALWAMTAEHDALHTILACARGYSASPILHSLAHHTPLHPDTTAAEEGLALTVAQLLNHARATGKLIGQP